MLSTISIPKISRCWFAAAWTSIIKDYPRRFTSPLVTYLIVILLVRYWRYMQMNLTLSSGIMVDGGYTGERFASLVGNAINADVIIAKKSDLKPWLISNTMFGDWAKPRLAGKMPSSLEGLWTKATIQRNDSCFIVSRLHAKRNLNKLLDKCSQKTIPERSHFISPQFEDFQV